MSNIKTMRLGDVAHLRAGFAFPLQFQGEKLGKYPFAKVGDISRAGRSGEKFISSADNSVEQQDLDRLQAKTVPAGSVLFAKIGEAIRLNHRVVAACDMLIDNNAMAAVPKDCITSSYLYHFLCATDLYRFTSTTTVPSLKKSVLEQLSIPLPSIAEQDRIATVLDQAEVLRAKRREALAQLDELTQSIFLDMFGDPTPNPKGWIRENLGELVEAIDSGQSPNCLDQPTTAGEWGVLKLGAVTKCEYDPAQNKALPNSVKPATQHEVKRGDLLFSRKNTYDLVAACAFVYDTPPRLLLPDLIFRLRLKSNSTVDPRYLHRLLIYPSKRRSVQSLAGGSSGSMPNISKAKLRTVPIELPPLELQREFARRVEAVDRLKEQHRAHLAELDALFASLQHRAFRGEL